MARSAVAEHFDSVQAADETGAPESDPVEHVPNPPERGDDAEEQDARGNTDDDVASVLAGGDMSAVRDFLAASMDQERKALHKWLKLDEKYGKTLSDARADYQRHQSRTARLWAAATRGLATAS